MTVLADIAVTYGVSTADLSLWIERRWILPMRDDGDYVFADADLARLGMIVELRRDLGVDDEAMPVVLGLLDQLHGLRRRVRRLMAAIDTLPAEQQDAVLKFLDQNSGKTAG
jgi:chaperone modulatory protein CbpM